MKAIILAAITVFTTFARADDCLFSKENELNVFSAIAQKIRFYAGSGIESAELFGCSPKIVDSNKILHELKGVFQRYNSESHLEDFPCEGDRITCPLQKWKAKLKEIEAEELDPKEQLQKVNDYVNETGFQDDLTRFGEEDHWATPKEFFGLTGDCEDFAIAKYISLRKLGWSESDLRLVRVKAATLNDQIHMVLVAKHDSIVYVLDNTHKTVEEQSAVTGYVPTDSYGGDSITNYGPYCIKAQ